MGGVIYFIPGVKFTIASMGFVSLLCRKNVVTFLVAMTVNGYVGTGRFSKLAVFSYSLHNQ